MSGEIKLSEASREALMRHVAQHYGPIHGELAVPTEAGAMTLLHVAPTPEVPFHVMVSAGLSDHRMGVPPEVEDAASFAELLMLLPFDWPVERGLTDGRVAWPSRVLASLAAFPLSGGADAWLGEGHSMPNGAPPQPFAPGLDFCGALLAPPMSLPPDARRFTRDDGTEVALLAVLPVFERELELKQEKGTAELLRRFDAAQVNELLDVERRSVAGLLLEMLDRNVT